MTVRLFADDACLSLDNTNAKSLQENVNAELVKVNQWLIYNKLHANYVEWINFVFLVLDNSTGNM
jgi:hypothetical protein